MAITTTMQPRQLWMNGLYAVLCLVLALWGWYDYEIKIPNDQKAFDEHKQLSEEAVAIEKTKETVGALTDAEIIRYEELTAKLKEYKDAPVEPGKYDRDIQMWLYIIGCGICGVPYFAWQLWSIGRRRYALGDDGRLVLPEGTFPIADIPAIDMSRWMSKSIAVITLPDGRTSTLDDYKFKGMDRIVHALVTRLEPGQWTDEVKPVKPDEPAPAETAESEPEGPARDGN